MTTFDDVVAYLTERTNNLTTGENGETAYISQLNPVVDLYSAQGALRGFDEAYLSYFYQALKHSPYSAIALLLKLRDVRRGQGERELFRSAMRYLEREGVIVKEDGKLFDLILHYGRADDLWQSFEGKEALRTVAKWIATKIASMDKQNPQVTLLAKWLPRKGKNAKEQYLLSVIRSTLNITPKVYRKMVVELSEQVVEKQMCAQKWEEIDFSKVPSQAMMRYRNAFMRNDEERFVKYIENLAKPAEERDEGFEEVKVNAGTLYPYQVMNSVNAGREAEGNPQRLFKAQWEALPDFFKGNTTSILPMVDVSGSMLCRLPGTSFTVMDAAISLGAYIAQRQTNAFKGKYLTFTDKPTLQDISSLLTSNTPIQDVYRYVVNTDVGYSTDFAAAIEVIFSTARKLNLPQEALPEVLMVFSDMNFDQCGSDNDTMHEKVLKLVEGYGYQPPKMVYWNLDHNGSFVCEINDQGVCEVSGFSPSILEDILANIDELTPLKVVERTIEPYKEDAQAFIASLDARREEITPPEYKSPTYEERVAMRRLRGK